MTGESEVKNNPSLKIAFLIYFIVIIFITAMFLPVIKGEEIAKINVDLSYGEAHFPSSWYSFAGHIGSYEQEETASNIQTFDDNYLKPRVSDDYGYALVYNFNNINSFDPLINPQQLQPEATDKVVISSIKISLILAAGVKFLPTNFPIQPTPPPAPEPHSFDDMSSMWGLNQEGYFSITWTYQGDVNLSNPKSNENWTDSSIIPWHSVPTSYFVTTGHSDAPYPVGRWWIYNYFNVYEWDITYLHTWTIDDIRNMDGHFKVLWTYKQNTSETPNNQIIQQYDYLGINYTWGYGLVPGTGVPPDENNLGGLVWLIIIFTPAILMAQLIPKLGYAAGVVLMLVVIGITNTSFLSVTVLGIISVGIMFYKGAL
jgi:hypothetical protein